MAKQLLIYERAVPVNPRQHGNLSVKSGADYGFAKQVNSVPLMAAEFEPACSEYAIVFAGQGTEITPVVLLGVRDQENLYIDDKGAWNAKYIPAFVRRYPFVFSSDNKGETFTLCVDEDFHGVNREGIGERLFDSAGERTQYLKTVLGFLQAYQAQFDATRAFCQRLVEHNLLEAMRAEFTLRTGQKITLGGFMSVNRERLRALSGETLARFAALGELDLIYAHLHSQRNFTATAERVLGVMAVADSTKDGVAAGAAA
jgi:hypothetical protein